MNIQDNKVIEKYVSYSKKNINEYIEKNDYKSAFQILVMVLNRVDEEQKSAIIKYYDDFMFEKYIDGRYEK